MLELNKIYCGDCLEELKKLPDESIDCVITSPPYWALRDYGVSGQLGLEPTFQEYITKLCDIFDEVKRVLKKEGTCWVNMGDTYGGSGKGVSNNGTGKTTLSGGKKKLETLTKENWKFDKRPITKDETQKSLCQIPSRFAIEMSDRGWILRNEIIWHKPNCMPASVKDRFTVDFEKLFFFVKNKKYWFETQYEKLANPNRTNFQSGRRTNGKNNDRNDNDLGKRSKDFKFDKRNKRSVWTINTKPKPFKEAHFAVYPEALCEIPIKAGCPKDGIVLDPFFGAGTTGVVAKKQDKKFIGIELNPEYIKIAEKRIKVLGEKLFV